LSKFYWKKDFEFNDAKPGYEEHIKGNNAAVVIGDRTFALNGNFKHEVDLAEEWKKMTSLPFVFAAWVTTSKMDDAFVQEFNNALKLGDENKQLAIQQTTKLPPGNFNALDYLTNKISYKLDDRKREGLNLFLKYISQL